MRRTARVTLLLLAACSPPVLAEPRLLPHVERLCDQARRVGELAACAEAGHVQARGHLQGERRGWMLLAAVPAASLAGHADELAQPWAATEDPTIACASAIVESMGDRRPANDVLGRFAFRTWVKERIAASRIEGCSSGLDEAQRDLAVTLAWQLLQRSPIAPLGSRGQR
jgi:hypothetical protein